jgi:hypothetical protein
MEAGMEPVAPEAIVSHGPPLVVLATAVYLMPALWGASATVGV